MNYTYNEVLLLQNENFIRKIQYQWKNIKIIDFDKERINEKIRTKLMERRGMKSIKIRYFDQIG